MTVKKNQRESPKGDYVKFPKSSAEVKIYCENDLGDYDLLRQQTVSFVALYKSVVVRENLHDSRLIIWYKSSDLRECNLMQ